MLITFKSRASGDVVMFGDVARQMLTIIGKRHDKQGVITVEQLPDAIARLKRALAENKAQHAKMAKEDDDTTPAGDQRAVSLSQRALPLIELLEYSLKAEQPVIWGG